MFMRMLVPCALVVFTSGIAVSQPKVDAPPMPKKTIVQRFVSPLKDKDGKLLEWKPNSYKFGEVCTYPNESGKEIEWGRHLGEDRNLPAGTKIYAMAPGKIAYANVRPGENRDKRNWGGLLITGNWTSATEALYIYYGHINIKKGLKQGDYLEEGDEVGEVAPKESKENGWWKDSHVHIQVNLDLDDKLPGVIKPNKEGPAGYAKKDAPYRLEDHMAATDLIRRFKPGMTIKELMK
jgi:murein DD-endopeptidase MepM/ murein hydrolase activator NlpD